MIGACAAGVLAIATASAPPPTDIAMRDAPFGLFGRSAWADVWVKVPPAAAFAVLTDYEHFHEFMPIVAGVVVEQRSTRHAVLRLRMTYLRWFTVEEVDERRLYPPSKVTYKGIAGPLKSLHGAWLLAPERGGTRVRYEAHVDPGVPVPGPVMAMLLTRGLPGLLDGVRRRAESGGTWIKGTF